MVEPTPNQTDCISPKLIQSVLRFVLTQKAKHLGIPFLPFRLEAN